MKSQMGTIKNKKRFFYWLKLTFLTPFWVFSPDKKPWAEFENTINPHKCEFGERVFKEPEMAYYYKKCKHYGCYTVWICNENGSDYKF